MPKRNFLFVINFLIASLFLLPYNSQSQRFLNANKKAMRWVNSVYQQLNDTQKIAQLMVVRAHSNLGAEHVAAVTQLINKYQIGALCFFQGGPVRQAQLTNHYQSISKVPLLICIDAEWGLGMRLDSVLLLPKQLTIGATHATKWAYAVGNAIGKQCKRMGIHVNYAPVADVNNNSNNPVINDRSFGENQYEVANMCIAYMQGLQQNGIMACAKHFPGHGDVSVDSHYDLPIIQKSIPQLLQTELVPFKKMIEKGVGSVMTAHLFIPSIDSTPNIATSLSAPAIKNLLQNQLQFKGIVVTDGLEMQGITKYHPNGEAAVQAIMAGNDMLCVPKDVPLAIEKTLEAIQTNRISWSNIEQKVKKVLLAKYHLIGENVASIDTTHLLADLNQHTLSLKRELATAAATVVRQQIALPIKPQQKIAYLSIGKSGTSLETALQTHYKATIFSYGVKNALGQQLMDDKNNSVSTSQNDSISAATLLAQLSNAQFDCIFVGIHNYSRKPANNFGFSKNTEWLLNQLSNMPNVMQCYFGNPYALRNSCTANNIAVFYEDEPPYHEAAFNWLSGKKRAKGKLPVSVCTFKAKTSSP